MDQDQTDVQFNTATARMLHREALRRAAQEMNSTSGPGLEGLLARISAESTAAAAEQVADHSVTVQDKPDTAFGSAGADVGLGPPAIR